MDLDSGEKLVRSLFGQIKNITRVVLSKEPLFTDEQLPAKLIPKRSKTSISCLFVPRTKSYRTLPIQAGPVYYEHTGPEGPGSLHAYLNEKGWIESLGAGSQSFDKTQSLS